GLRRPDVASRTAADVVVRLRRRNAAILSEIPPPICTISGRSAGLNMKTYKPSNCVMDALLPGTMNDRLKRIDVGGLSGSPSGRGRADSPLRYVRTGMRYPTVPLPGVRSVADDALDGRCQQTAHVRCGIFFGAGSDGDVAQRMTYQVPSEPLRLVARQSTPGLAEYVGQSLTRRRQE